MTFERRSTVSAAAARRTLRRSAHRAALPLAAALFAGWAPAQNPGEEEGEPRIFRVPLDADAQMRADHVLDFAAQQNWTRTAEELQVLFDQHGGAVLAERFARDQSSQYDLHPGAAHWAEETLAGLPPEARDRYRACYGPEAEAAFAEAIARADRRSLTAVAARYPMTDAGVRAWYAVGDLELELGNGEAALAAWERARSLAAAIGAGTSAGAGARFEVAKTLAERAAAEAETTPAGGPAWSGSTPPVGPVPEAGADRWTVTDLDFTPFTTLPSAGIEPFNLFAVQAGDSLVFSTTLRVYCIDVFSAKVRWATPEPAGWEQLNDVGRNLLFHAIDTELCLVAPAAKGGVVVAALQIPYANQEDHDYQGIEIMTPIPERRLFAFDLATGAELWNHAPPLDWDGESGTFAQKMLVAAPPVVHGSRVVVPCYRMEGRIDLHVACYDLRTGALLWTTGLVSGQRELNMFGRPLEEFCGAPVTIADDSVYVVTQLGTLARLDLFSGRILWESRYEQIPIPKNRGWQTSGRDVFWRNSPPAVTDEVVVATPHDSKLLIGADRETGAVLWSYDYDDLPVARGTPGKDAPGYSVLLGAEDDVIYLGGGAVSALQKPGGLKFHGERRRGPRHDAFEARWSVPSTSFARMPRAVLGADEVVIPTYEERLVVDRGSGARIASKSVPWSNRDPGNMLIGKGLFVTLGNRKLQASLDWSLLLERAEKELAARPDDVDARVRLADLLQRRARANEASGRPEGSAALLLRAREVLDGAALSPGGARHPRVAQSLYGVLREQARGRELEADGEGALALLAEALALATAPEDVRDTLLEEEQVLARRDPVRWRTVLSELETRAGNLPLPAEHLSDGVERITGESLLVIAPDELAGADLTVGLWVLFARADAAARNGELAAALADLHAALARHGERELAFGLTAGDVARARIARRIELDGREPYAPFEERAAELLERALAAHDPVQLAEVERLYPHSAAAVRATALSLDWALDSGDPEASAALAYRAFSSEPRPTEADAQVLVRLGAVIAASGNEELYSELLRMLGREAGELVSSLPAHEGRTFAELAREIDSAGGLAPLPRPSFGENLERQAVFEGRYSALGVLPAGPAAAEHPPVATLILSGRSGLVALGSDDPERARWTFDFEFQLADDNVVLLHDRVVAGGGSSVLALGALSGDVLWSADLAGEEVKALAATAGTVIALTTAGEDDERSYERIRAFDAYSGLALWSLSAGDDTGWTRPVCAEGKAVFLRPWWASSSAALVVDVFRGRILAELDLADTVPVESWTGAWIENGEVVVPFFSASRNGGSRVQAFDLKTGAVRWTLGFDEGVELSSIAAFGDSNYLVVLPVATAQGGDAGEVLELDAAAGRTRRIAALKSGEDTMGLARKERTVLSDPFLFTYQVKPGARTIPVRMIPLAGDVGWIYHLPLSYEELYNDGLPRPAVSGDLIAIAYSTKNRSNLSRDEAHLELVDKAGGFRRASMLLSPQMSKSHVKLYGLGPALLSVGLGRLGSRDISQVEVLESVR